MPVLVLAVPENLHKLLKNGGLTAATSLRKLCGVMIMTIHLAVMLIVAVLGPKHRWTERASEVIDVVFSIERGDVGTPEGSAAFVAKQT